jgi:hypothetical protein
MQKHIWASGIIFDETVAALGNPHFLGCPYQSRLRAIKPNRGRSITESLALSQPCVASSSFNRHLPICADGGRDQAPYLG